MPRIVSEADPMLSTALLADPGDRLAALAPRRSTSVQTYAPREDVAPLIEHQRLAAIPVVDIDDRPVGVLSQRALASVAEQEVAAGLQTMVGASRDERALSSVPFAVRKRLPWLQVNLITAFLAAAVVGLFENTIAAFTAHLARTVRGGCSTARGSSSTSPPALVLSKGIERSLTAELDASAAALDRGGGPAAIHTLEAFVREVERLIPASS